MSLLQVQQLSRHPTDYGAEILVQVMMMMIMALMVSIATMTSLMMMSMMTQDDYVFATSRGTGILVVYKIDSSGKLSRYMVMMLSMMMTMMISMMNRVILVVCKIGVSGKLSR